MPVVPVAGYSLKWIMKGKSKEIQEMADRILATRGVEFGQAGIDELRRGAQNSQIAATANWHITILRIMLS